MTRRNQVKEIVVDLLNRTPDEHLVGNKAVCDIEVNNAVSKILSLFPHQWIDYSEDFAEQRLVQNETS